jgi:creatinine amidohydrolase
MVWLEQMTSSELNRLIQSGARTVVIPFGSVEQHGGHLPLGTDALLADVVGHAVADRLDAVLAPTIRVGCADQRMNGPGTLTMSAATLRRVAFQTARSLVLHGFRVIALVSTHGGNHVALEQAARQLNAQYRDVVACAPRGDVGPNPGAHSGRWLTSVMLCLRPDLVARESAGAEIIDEVRAASPADGAHNLERFVSAIIQGVRDTTREQSLHPSSAAMSERPSSRCS